VRTRTLEAYAKHYTMAWPHEEHHSGRPTRTSPLYSRLAAAGAVFGEKLGWERPNWFAYAAHGDVDHDVYTFGRQNWFAAVGREHAACREAAVLFDQTSFAKFTVTGRDALDVLDHICANDIRKPIGALTYTQMLDERGGIQCDLTVARVADDEFYLVTGTGFATHDFDWIRRNVPDGAAATLTDVTSSKAVLALMGPASRSVLASVCDEDLSNDAHPFGVARTVHIAGAPVLAMRVTYVGELGWELHLPVEFAAAVYDELMRVGAPLGLVNAGYRAIESLRLEKGYRAWGSEIGPDHTPLEAGLGWAVKLRTDRSFIGRAAAEAQRAAGVRKMLAGFSVDGAHVLLGRETIYRNGERVGWLTSGGYGYTVGASLGYGYVRWADGVSADWLLAGDYELEVATERVPAVVGLKPWYDPAGARIKS
jgi:sarcosine dehydrogenase